MKASWEIRPAAPAVRWARPDARLRVLWPWHLSMAWPARVCAKFMYTFAGSICSTHPAMPTLSEADVPTHLPQVDGKMPVAVGLSLVSFICFAV